MGPVAKLMLTALVIFLAGVAGFMYLVSIATADYKKQHQPYIDKIGDTIVLKKDTLIIVDYSVLNQSFKLSNGAEVAKSLISKN